MPNYLNGFKQDVCEFLAFVTSWDTDHMFNVETCGVSAKMFILISPKLQRLPLL